ncbi:MAG: response regulator [Candidatus Hodarchaeota archaeon]
MEKIISGDKAKIMVVEDNEDLLFNMEMTLEFNGYDVITAKNGYEAFKILLQEEVPPDLIISDIMMPELDGYEFFKKVSENPKLGLIPFLFLSARASPEEVRFGKMLGVDDYLTKPLDFELLLAIIAGKISRKGKADLIRKKMDEKLLSSLDIDLSPSLSKGASLVEAISMIIMNWNESRGPELKAYYSKRTDESFQETIGSQLFHAAAAIYGQTGLFKAQGILINVENFERVAYVYFDSFKDDTVRGGDHLFMIAVIAPKISYFESIKLKEIMQRISKEIKGRFDYYEREIGRLEEDWKKISKILSTSPFNDYK